MRPEELAREAEALCVAADREILLHDRPRAAERLARRAFRLFREAARLSPDPERCRLFVRAADLAASLEAPKAVCSVVREACRYDPDYETERSLRDHWDDWAWLATRAGDPPPFPEPKPAGSRTLLDREAPIPGQLELFEEGGPS